MEWGGEPLSCSPFQISDSPVGYKKPSVDLVRLQNGQFHFSFCSFIVILEMGNENSRMEISRIPNSLPFLLLFSSFF